MWCELAQYETGGAWLSSARVVRCWVKSRNERNPYRPLLTGSAEDSDETAGDNSEEGGRRQIIMPLTTWATHVLQWVQQRDARPQGGAKLRKVLSVQIVGCNPPT